MPPLPVSLAAVFAAALLLGCNGADAPATYAARVGDAYLTDAELAAALQTLPVRQDTSEARRQLIEQWVTNELLYQEALRRDLLEAPEVQRRLAESQRAVLVEALVSGLYAEQEGSVGAAEVRAYFDRHRERLRLREPFVRVRYLATAHPDSAQRALDALGRLGDTDADAGWDRLVDRYAEDPDGARALAATYYPESRLFADRPALREALGGLTPGQAAPLTQHDSLYHVLQLADRVPAGTLPELPWIEAEVRRLLAIEARKQMFERQVERLRAEALARDALTIR